MNAVTTRVLILAALAHAPALAAAFSFQGTFTTDDQVQFFDLSLSADSVVTFQSYGYGGGVNAAGQTIAPGGFDSEFSWFANDGTLIGSDDDGCGSAGIYNDACLDAAFTGTLTAGEYILALTESPNNPTDDLADGFTAQGQGNFTCPQGFCDYLGGQDTGNWAVDISAVDSASAESAAPEPAAFLLTGAGLAGLAVAGRGRRNR